MAKGDIHIIGAGLAGLAAAVSLSDEYKRIIIHELSRNAGGRCRSYYDPILSSMIDNGNHLVLSSNRHTLLFLEKIGSAHLLPVPMHAEFSFYDLDQCQQWKLQLNDSFIPWWFFFKTKRIPDSSYFDYFHIVSFILKSLLWDRPISQINRPKNNVFKNLINPVLLAALNTKIEESSSRLAAKTLLKTLGKGGRACKPLISIRGLGSVFVDPALKYLENKGAQIIYNHQLRSLLFKEKKVISLVFDDQKIHLKDDDKVVLAVPAWVANVLIPNLRAPNEFSPIVNLHYSVQLPKKIPPLTAVLNGCSEWIFSFPGRVSVTISAAEHLVETDRELLAIKVWEEIKIITGLEMKLPPWQIVKEKRATFKATSYQNSLRPPPQTEWTNLVLAGDWTQTGYPATIEGAIYSGDKAAKLIRT